MTLWTSDSSTAPADDIKSVTMTYTMTNSSIGAKCMWHTACQAALLPSAPKGSVDTADSSTAKHVHEAIVSTPQDLLARLQHSVLLKQKGLLHYETELRSKAWFNTNGSFMLLVHAGCPCSGAAQHEHELLFSIPWTHWLKLQCSVSPTQELSCIFGRSCVGTHNTDHAVTAHRRCHWWRRQLSPACA